MRFITVEKPGLEEEEEKDHSGLSPAEEAVTRAWVETPFEAGNRKGLGPRALLTGGSMSLRQTPVPSELRPPVGGEGGSINMK